jgi:hypothetical protein
MAEEIIQSVKEPAKADTSQPKEDYEKKYKELQPVLDQRTQELKVAKETLDAVTPYINWELANPKPAQAEDEYVKTQFVTEQNKKVSDNLENKILELQFRVDNPDLREYETTLVAPALLKVRKSNPMASKEKLLELAAKDVREFLESERKKGEDRVKKDKAKNDAVTMSGLDSVGNTIPIKDEGGESLSDYVKNRQKLVNKKKGI